MYNNTARCLHSGMCLKIGKGRAATAWQRCHQLIRAKSQSTSKSGWSVGLLGWAKVREHSMLVAVTTELAFFSRVRFCFCASDSRTKLIIRQGAKKAVAQVCPEQHNMVPENCTVGLSKVARYACPSTDSGIATASARLQGSNFGVAGPNFGVAGPNSGQGQRQEADDIPVRPVKTAS